MPSADIEGLEINYLHFDDAQSADAKKLIYIHGTGCNVSVFEAHLRALKDDYEVVAIDLPGHGASSGEGFRNAVDHAFFVGGLIEHLAWQRCVVAGHSLGGGIALAVAIYFEPLVEALMLIDTGARLRVNPNIIEAARRAAVSGKVPRTNSRWGYADSTDQSVIDDINEKTADCRAEVIYKDWIADDSFDVMSRLATLNMPTLAICGAEDPLTPPKYHAYLRDHMPQCQMETIPRAAHWPFVENPSVFNEKVREFLQTLA